MLVLYFDFGSLRSFVALARLERLVDPTRIVWMGMDVLGLATSVPADPAYRTQVEIDRDLAADAGLQVRVPARRPATTPAHAVADAAEAAGLGSEWRHAVFRACFVDALDIADPHVLGRLGASVGFGADRVNAVLSDSAAVLAVRRRSIAYRRRGIGDVPVLEFDGTLLDPLIGADELRALSGWGG